MGRDISDKSLKRFIMIAVLYGFFVGSGLRSIIENTKEQAFAKASVSARDSHFEVIYILEIKDNLLC